MRSVADDLLRLGDNKITRPVFWSATGLWVCACISSDVFLRHRSHFQEVNKLYISGTHNSLASVAAFDMRAVALTYLSFSSFILGNVEQAESLSAQALTWSRNLRLPHNLAFALSYAALLKMLDQSDSAADRAADELITLTTEHHFPAYMAVAIFCADGCSRCAVKPRRDWCSFAKDCPRARMRARVGTRLIFSVFLPESCEDAGLADEALED